MQDAYSSTDDLDSMGLEGDTDTIQLDLTDAPAKSGRSRASSTTAAGGKQDVAAQVQEKAGEVASQVQDTTSNVVGQVKEQATSQITSQKDRAAEGLGNIADTIRQTGHELHNRDQANIAQYVDRAAQRVEDLSSYLSTKDLNGIITDVEHFARRQPMLFLAGAFTVGLLGARFLKSSSQSAQTGDYSGGAGTMNRYNSGAYLDSPYSDTGYGADAMSGTSASDGTDLYAGE